MKAGPVLNLFGVVFVTGMCYSLIGMIWSTCCNADPGLPASTKGSGRMRLFWMFSESLVMHERIDELEIRLAFQEEIDALNLTVVRQQQEFDTLRQFDELTISAPGAVVTAGRQRTLARPRRHPAALLRQYGSGRHRQYLPAAYPCRPGRVVAPVEHVGVGQEEHENPRSSNRACQ